MAKLKALPSLAIISGFRGVIDYYVNYQSCDREVAGKGIPCARRWPRSPGHLRSPAVMEQWSTFTDASKYWSQLTPEIQGAYNKMAEATGLSGRDMFTRGYISGLYRYETAPPPPPPPIDIGAAAIDRSTTSPAGYTFISKENPAEFAGIVKKVALFFNTTCSGLQVAIFTHVAANTFTTRSHAAIGAAPVGYSEHEVELAAEAGDFIGYYCTAGFLDRDNAGEGYWYFNADKIPCTGQLFTFGADRTASLYGWSGE